MGLESIVIIIFKVLSFLIFIRIILSWIPHNNSHPLVNIVYQITDPILIPIQGIIPPSRLGGFDISPIIALFLLNFLRNTILSLLF